MVCKGCVPQFQFHFQFYLIAAAGVVQGGAPKLYRLTLDDIWRSVHALSCHVIEAFTAAVCVQNCVSFIGALSHGIPPSVATSMRLSTAPEEVHCSRVSGSEKAPAVQMWPWCMQMAVTPWGSGKLPHGLHQGPAGEQVWSEAACALPLTCFRQQLCAPAGLHVSTSGQRLRAHCPVIALDSSSVHQQACM